jgi:hypothetical protein
MMKPYTKAQFVALTTFLTYWPNGLTYAQVIDRLQTDGDVELDDSDTIDNRGDFEDLWPEHIAQLITDLHDHLINVYGDI